MCHVLRAMYSDSPGLSKVRAMVLSEVRSARSGRVSIRCGHEGRGVGVVLSVGTGVGGHSPWSLGLPVYRFVIAGQNDVTRIDCSPDEYQSSLLSELAVRWPVDS